MKRCTQCGVLNSDHLDTCGSCGARGDSLVPVKEDADHVSLAVGVAPAEPAPVEAPIALEPEPEPPPPPRRGPTIAAAVCAFVAVGTLAAWLGLREDKPIEKPEAPRFGFPDYKPDGPDAPTDVPRGPGSIVWKADLRNQTHTMLTIDGG